MTSSALNAEDDPRMPVALARARSPESLAIMLQAAEDLPDKPTYRDFELGLRTNYDYAAREIPELLKGGLHVIDVGPGIGCFMVVATALGNDVEGEELELDSSQWVRAYATVTAHWACNIRYGGFHRYLIEDLPNQPESVDIIHFRGVFDSVVGMSDLGIVKATKHLLTRARRVLRRGGFIHIAHNDTPSLAEIRKALHSSKKGWKLVRDEPTVTRIVKS